MIYKFKQFIPLITFVVPSIIISIIMFVLMKTEWTMIVGFVVLLLSACFTYFMGIRGVLKEQDTET
ncbi:hypothetical protein ES705_07921 [subsurface metagenome]